GGLLSLLNYHWLRSSIASALNVEKRPRVKIISYIVRYFVTGGAVFVAYKLEMISLPATLAGLCSFVPALFVEAFRQFYLAIRHREESCCCFFFLSKSLAKFPKSRRNRRSSFGFSSA